MCRVDANILNKHTNTHPHTHTHITKGFKRRLISSNVCYHSAQNTLSSGLLLRNVKIIIHKTIILPVVLYGYETGPLILREGHRVWVFENSVTRIFGLQRD
jgi:hypothetical protein